MDDFPKYPKIFALGVAENKSIFTDNPEDDIAIQEKIDGANLRVYITASGKTIFGSRTQQLSSDEGEDANIQKNFLRAINFLKEKFKDKDLTPFSHLILYMEACHRHTINYDWEKIPPVLAYDVWDKRTQKMLPEAEAVVVYDSLGIQFVPRVGHRLAGELFNMSSEQIDALVPVSAYALESAEDRRAEGIVFKNQRSGDYAKYVRAAFKERNAATFGGNPKFKGGLTTNDEEFVFTYCTNARIEKLVMKQIDAGALMSMTMMGPLIKATYEDIIEEHWREILTSNWTLRFQECRKMIAKRCCAVLQQMITNNGLGKVGEKPILVTQ